MDIEVVDHVLPDPDAYRAAVLSAGFQDVALGPAVFRGIGLAPNWSLPAWVEATHPGWRTRVTFARQSPAGQVEPNYIHTDRGMGDWTAILYLTPTPPAGDGTTFWRRRDTGAHGSETDADDRDWHDTAQFEPWRHVEAAFNRVLLFPAPYYHSRALLENYGAGADARLVQVAFGVVA